MEGIENARRQTTYSTTPSAQSVEVRHHIYVKQELCDPVPKRGRKYSMIIDLTESDDDDTLDTSTTDSTPSSASAVAAASTATTAQTTTLITSFRSSPSDASSSSSSGKESSTAVPKVKTKPAIQKRQKTNVSQSALVSQAPIPAFKQSSPVASTGLVQDAPQVSRSYWARRVSDNTPRADFAISPSKGNNDSTQATSRMTTTPVPSLAMTNTTAPQAIIGSPAIPTAQSSGAAKPAPSHPYKYRGPALTVISLRAIWDHLDKAWSSGRSTIGTITQLSNWWAVTPVTAAHKLDKKQIWLLAYADYKWWQALEDQWQSFDALPIKDRGILLKMKEVRLKKEWRAAKAEMALNAEGSVKDAGAAYLISIRVKIEKESKIKQEKENVQQSDAEASTSGQNACEETGKEKEVEKEDGIGDVSSDSETDNDEEDAE